MSITNLLKSVNLLQYETALLDQGADDIQQLVDVSDNDFEELLRVIGMDTKPFHVMRFKKALGRVICDQVTKSRNDILCHTPSVNTHTVTVYATQLDDPTSSASCVTTPTSNDLITHRSPPPLTSSSQNYIISPGVLPVVQSLSQQLFISSADQLQSLCDESIIIQKQLGPSPISPDVWDPGRRELIRNASQTFFTQCPGQELSFHEQVMNEASYQLCLWDPTLLIRREELFLLARKLVRILSPGGAIHLKYTGPPMTKPTRKGRSCPYQVNRGPDGKFRACFEMNYELRERQLGDVERLLSENLAEEQVKQALLVEAKQKKDYSLALKLQEEISALGQTQRHLKVEISHIKKKQRRSIRHQEIKKIKNEQKTDETNSSQTLAQTPSLDNQPPLSSSFQGQPPQDISLENTHPVSLNDETPLQLHTYIHESVTMSTESLT